MASLLDQLRTLSAVDCDTLDVEVAKKLGPFVDCTSNQAIAFAELSKVDNDGTPLHQQLILESIKLAHWQFGKQSDATLEELAVELMMVGLSLRFAPHTTGYLHVQTNPIRAYSTQKTVKNAERIVSHFKQLAPEFDASRICIKIPSTWEGLQACRELEKRGISTLATTVFGPEQAVLAADVGCTYIAPYVNELRVHFDPSYTDTRPALLLCGAAQRYMESKGKRTQVVAASLTSIEQVLRLAGAVRHITVSAPLLEELAAIDLAGWKGGELIGQVGKSTAGLGGGAGGTELGAESWDKLEQVGREQTRWRMAVTMSEAECERKQLQAIVIFVEMQEKLEEMVRKADVEVRAGSA
ncbi:Transaldolase [Madurella fahalii]|uniref:Transaldolase n=1 Tax=Madurella fahalii TaxID=1157608 RepID=A0ABQ0GJ32_9PEZI